MSALQRAEHPRPGTVSPADSIQHLSVRHCREQVGRRMPAAVCSRSSLPIHARRYSSQSSRLLRQQTTRVRHCLRRSRESDAQRPLAQLIVTATRISNAEHVTPASAMGAFLHGFAMKPSFSGSAIPSGPSWASLDLAFVGTRAAAHVTGTRCCEATKLTRPDHCTSGRSRWKAGVRSCPGMPDVRMNRSD